jgi:hypothetical protein
VNTFLRRLSATLLLTAALVGGTAGTAAADPRHDTDRGCKPLPTRCEGGDAPGFGLIGKKAGDILDGLVR